MSARGKRGLTGIVARGEQAPKKPLRLGATYLYIPGMCKAPSEQRTLFPARLRCCTA